MGGVRNNFKYIRGRSGFASAFSSRYGNKSSQVYNGSPVRGRGNTNQYGYVRPISTGGRTSGKNWLRPDQTRSPGGRRPNVGTYQVKDGPVVVLPLDHYDGVPFYPTASPLKPADLGIKRKRVLPDASGSTYSYSKLFAPKRVRKTRMCRMLRKGVSLQSCEYFSTSRVETVAGIQNYASLSWLGAPALNNMAAGSGTGSGQKTAELWLINGNLSAMITNNSNVNAFVEIWEGYYRRTAKDEASTLFRQGLTDQGLAGPSVPAGYSANPDNLYMMDPLKSRMFCQMCKITNVTTFELGTGRSHQHRSRLYVNAKYNNELYQEYGTTYPYVEGFSRVFMIFLRGGPINDQTTTTNVAPGAVALDVIYTMKYNYFYNTPNTATVYTGGSFPSIGTAVTVNEATGAVIVDTKG